MIKSGPVPVHEPQSSSRQLSLSGHLRLGGWAEAANRRASEGRHWRGTVEKTCEEVVNIRGARGRETVDCGDEPCRSTLRYFGASQSCIGITRAGENPARGVTSSGKSEVVGVMVPGSWMVPFLPVLSATFVPNKLKPYPRRWDRCRGGRLQMMGQRILV